MWRGKIPVLFSTFEKYKRKQLTMRLSVKCLTNISSVHESGVQGLDILLLQTKR